MPHNTDEIDLKEAIRITIVGTIQYTAIAVAIILAVHLTIGLGTYVPL